jgi:hypothetical protein
MHILLVSLVVAAGALLLLVLPALALQALLRLVRPGPRGPLTAREREMDDAVEELPPRVLELLRLAR